MSEIKKDWTVLQKEMEIAELKGRLQYTMGQKEAYERITLMLLDKLGESEDE